MKILLINPYWPYPYSKGEHTYNRIWPPLSLATCASILEKQGCDVKILDAHAERIKPDRISPHIMGYDKIFITSSTLDKWICPNISIKTFLETVSAVRKGTDELYVIGYHGTKDPEHVLNITNAKAVIRGEPENIIADICSLKNLDEIRGITFQKNGKVTSNPPPKNVDMSKLPTPAYHLLDMRKYHYEILGDNFTLFELSRGCNYNCNFCSKIMFGDHLRQKNISQIREEISTAITQHNIKTGYFIDLDFLSNNGLIEDLCDFLIHENYDFKWCCQTRPDSIDPEILKKMKNAGCSLIHFGIESSEDRILDIANKQTSLAGIEEAVSLCKKLKIDTLAFYLFGFKDETDLERENTFRFARKLNTDYISLHKIHPYRSSDIYQNDTATDKKIDLFIKKSYIRYFLRLKKFRLVSFSKTLQCIKLFFCRIISL